MELRHLRYFQAVAEELSFSQASRRLRIAQPALSRAVQELERELGAILIQRETRPPSLTPAGKVLLSDIARITEQLDEMIRRVQRTSVGAEGELRLGYIGPPTRDFLAPLLKDFSSKYPRVTINLEERTPERVWEMVAQGRLSVGITRPVLAHEALGLKTMILRHEKFCAAVPHDHPWADRDGLTWKSLACQPLIVLARREGASSHDAIQAACAENGFQPKLVHTPSLIGTILQYVQAGAGIGIVPESTHSSQLKLIPLRPARTIPLMLVWPKQTDDPMVSAFRKVVEARFKSSKSDSKLGGE
ncbi:MAG: LysR family transcriptional regulator [Verrucomicrobiaceae bacterium]|nr:LysR family transcriptional regulator [Verrucomicrobiaceae bacterium]